MAKKITRKGIVRYVKSKGTTCPACGSDNIVGEEVMIRGNQARQNVTCECGAWWRMLYQLHAVVLEDDVYFTNDITIAIYAECLAWALARLVEHCRLIDGADGKVFYDAQALCDRLRKKDLMPLTVPEGFTSTAPNSPAWVPAEVAVARIWPDLIQLAAEGVEARAGRIEQVQGTAARAHLRKVFEEGELILSNADAIRHSLPKP